MPNDEENEQRIDEEKLTECFEEIKKRSKNKMKDFMKLI